MQFQWVNDADPQLVISGLIMQPQLLIMQPWWVGPVSAAPVE